MAILVGRNMATDGQCRAMVAVRVWQQCPVAQSGSGFHDTSEWASSAVSGGLSIHDGSDFSGAHIIHAVHPGEVIRSDGASWLGGPPLVKIVTKSADEYYVIYQGLMARITLCTHFCVGRKCKSYKELLLLDQLGPMCILVSQSVTHF